ncbi:MAG: hypothetical protein K2M96_10685 [Prevotella sp.]|nr:hypothetical protein [Prevotella sp.]
MIKIFIESGVNDSQKRGKDTTNEQDFIVNIVAKHFPECQYGKDYEIVGTGGWTNLPNLVYEFKSNSDVEGQNLVIFDADENRNGGGFANRQGEINRLLEPHQIEFRLFLWPDNRTDGDFELLLSKIVNSEHRCLLDSYEHFEEEVRNNDPDNEKYDIPGRKGEMYTYISLHKKSGIQNKKFKKGYWLFDDERYWNLSSDELRPLLDFFRPYFSNRG